MDKITKGHKVSIEPIETTDLETIWDIAYGQAENTWMDWNGPYFNDPVYEKEAYLTNIGVKIIADQRTWAIKFDRNIVGTVTYYYADGNLEKWLEVGICIYDPEYWNKGIATTAMKLWIDYLFGSVTDLPHIGFTTWSGNKGMMRVGEKLGMILEGRIRKVRYFQNQYWDSIKFGILRTEWTQSR